MRPIFSVMYQFPVWWASFGKYDKVQFQLHVTWGYTMLIWAKMKLS